MGEEYYQSFTFNCPTISIQGPKVETSFAEVLLCPVDAQMASYFYADA